MATTVMDEFKGFREKLEARKAELLPELEEIDRVLGAMDPPKKTRRRPRSSGSTPTGPGRSEEFVKIVTSSPGITVADAAKQMDMDGPNYLYRIARDLVNNGALRKEGPAFFPTEATAAVAESETVAA